MRFVDLREEDEDDESGTRVRTHDNPVRPHQRFSYGNSSNHPIEHVAIFSPKMKQKALALAKKYPQGANKPIGTVFVFADEAAATKAAVSVAGPKFGPYIAMREEIVLAADNMTWPNAKTRIPDQLLVKNAIAFLRPGNANVAERAISAAGVRYKKSAYGVQFQYSSALWDAIIEPLEADQQAVLVEAAWQTVWPFLIVANRATIKSNQVAQKSPYAKWDNLRAGVKALTGI